MKPWRPLPSLRELTLAASLGLAAAWVITALEILP
jgi:hypothetical protein